MFERPLATSCGQAPKPRPERGSKRLTGAVATAGGAPPRQAPESCSPRSTIDEVSPSSEVEGSAGVGPDTLATASPWAFWPAVGIGTVLVVVAVLNTAVSAYYYLRLIIVMFFRERTTEWTAPRVPASLALAIIIAVAGVFYLGLFPNKVIDAFQKKPIAAQALR